MTPLPNPSPLLLPIGSPTTTACLEEHPPGEVGGASLQFGRSLLTRHQPLSWDLHLTGRHLLACLLLTQTYLLTTQSLLLLKQSCLGQRVLGVPRELLTSNWTSGHLPKVPRSRRARTPVSGMEALRSCPTCRRPRA